MRRFSSEGSLLGLDLLSWKSASRKVKPNDEPDTCGTLPHHADKVDKGTSSHPSSSTIFQNAVSRPRKEFTKEVNVEGLTDLDIAPGLPQVTSLSESFKAYSDSQLAPGISSDSVEQNGGPSPSPSPSPTSTVNPFCFQTGTHHHRHQVRSKLSSAKLHLKSLFGQSPHSFHVHLTPPEHGESSTKERRSRFVKQWSQVGHAKTRLNRVEVEKWAESLDAVLDSRVGVSVFQAFLRSEFSEENLQFYLACEQYKHSSTTFSLQRRAKEISGMYIQPGAPREVNLDNKTRELTLRLLKAPSHVSLNHAQRRIRSLLETDCYPRFLQSNVYLTLLDEAQ